MRQAGLAGGPMAVSVARHVNACGDRSALSIAATDASEQPTPAGSAHSERRTLLVDFCSWSSGITRQSCCLHPPCLATRVPIARGVSSPRDHTRWGTGPPDAGASLDSLSAVQDADWRPYSIECVSLSSSCSTPCVVEERERVVQQSRLYPQPCRQQQAERKKVQ